VTDKEPRFSLVAGEGDGAMLGLAAGDTAGGAWELGYSAVTEQAVVIAYQLIEQGHLIPDLVTAATLELDGSDSEEPVYRSESPNFRAWLDGAAAGHPAVEMGPSLDGAPRAVPVGVAFRRQPDVLRREALTLGRLFHGDDSSVLAGVVTAGAVAASCFGQSGRDLLAGVIEMIEPLASELTQASRSIGDLSSLHSHLGVADGAKALQLVSGDGGMNPVWDQVKAGLLLAAPVIDRPHVAIEQAAKIGGSPLAGMVGGIVGARVGIRAWPWAFANDTWFAEVGRRLARGPNELTDLPIPYAVEHHLIAGERQGLY
jgi:ADP-ribosylglycohydrolase